MKPACVSLVTLTLFDGGVAFHAALPSLARSHATSPCMHALYHGHSMHDMTKGYATSLGAVRMPLAPRRRLDAVKMNAAVGMALDGLGMVLKLAWRAMIVVCVLALTKAWKKAGATGGSPIAKVQEAARAVLQPGKVKAEREAAAEEAERAAAAERRARIAKEAEEESAAEKMAELQRAAEQMAREKEEQERLEKENAERKAAFDAAQEAKEEAKQAAEAAEIERKKKLQEHMRRVKEAADKAAAEEQAAYEKEQAEKKAAEEARLAAIEAAKTPEQRAAEAAAKAAEEAAREEQLKREAEQRAAAAAAKAEGAGLVASVDRDPVGEGYVGASPATDASIAALFTAASSEAGAPRLFGPADLHADMQGALMESIKELEAGYTKVEDKDELKESLTGMWRLLFTSDEGFANNGITNQAATPRREVLGGFTAYSKPDEYSGAPTLQTVEVVSDNRVGRAILATMSGDFFVGKLQSTGELGVVDDYTKLEFDEMRQGDGTDLVPTRWSSTYLSPTLRVARTESDAVLVYEKCDIAAAQDTIATLLATEVEQIEDMDGTADEEEDDRPIWQRRLDAEKDQYERFGPTTSDIP